MKPAQEQRRRPRYLIKSTFEVSLTVEGDTLEGQLMDVSTHGVRVRVAGSHTLRRGSRARATFERVVGAWSADVRWIRILAEEGATDIGLLVPGLQVDELLNTETGQPKPARPAGYTPAVVLRLSELLGANQAAGLWADTCEALRVPTDTRSPGEQLLVLHDLRNRSEPVGPFAATEMERLQQRLRLADNRTPAD